VYYLPHTTNGLLQFVTTEKPETNVDNNIMGWLNGLLIKQGVGSFVICLSVLHFRKVWGKVTWSAMRTVGWLTV
jgi:hypothetical protein